MDQLFFRIPKEKFTIVISKFRKHDCADTGEWMYQERAQDWGATPERKSMDQLSSRLAKTKFLLQKKRKTKTKTKTDNQYPIGQKPSHILAHPKYPAALFPNQRRSPLHYD